MPILAWTCAHGDSPSVSIPCAATVAIAPDDDSVDTNQIIVSGTGTISSFGPCSTPITKRVAFSPGVTLKHGPNMVLLTGNADRVLSLPGVGTYMTAGGTGIWTEINFAFTGYIDPLGDQVATLEQQVAALQSEVATLQSQVAAHTTTLALHADWINYIANAGPRPPTDP